MATQPLILLTEVGEQSLSAPPTQRQTKRSGRPQGLPASYRRQKAGSARGLSRAIRVGVMVAAAVASMTYALRCVTPRLASTEDFQGRIKSEDGKVVIRRLAAGEGNGPWMPRGRLSRGNAVPGRQGVECVVAFLEEPASPEVTPYLLPPDSSARLEPQSEHSDDAPTVLGQQFRLFGEPGKADPWHFLGDRLPALELGKTPSQSFRLESLGDPGEETGRHVEASKFSSPVRGASASGRAGGVFTEELGSEGKGEALVTGVAPGQTAVATGITSPDPHPTRPPVFGYFSYSPSEAPVPVLLPEAVLLESIRAAEQTPGADPLQRVAELRMQLGLLSSTESGDAAADSDSAPAPKPYPSASPLSYSAVASRGIAGGHFSIARTKPSSSAAHKPQRTPGAQGPGSQTSSVARTARASRRSAAGTARSGSSVSRVDAVERTARTSSTRVLGLHALRSSQMLAASSGARESSGGAHGQELSDSKAAASQSNENRKVAHSSNGGTFKQSKGHGNTRKAIASGGPSGDTVSESGREAQGSGRGQKGQSRKQADGLREVDARGPSPGDGGNNSRVRRGKGGEVDGAGRGATGGGRTGAWLGKGRQASASRGEGKGKATAPQREPAGERGATGQPGGSFGGEPPGGSSASGDSGGEGSGRGGDGGGDGQGGRDKRRSEVVTETKEEEENNKDRDDGGGHVTGTESGDNGGDTGAPDVLAPVAGVSSTGMVAVAAEPLEEVSGTSVQTVGEGAGTPEVRAVVTGAGQSTTEERAMVGGSRPKQCTGKSRAQRTKGGQRPATRDVGHQGSMSVGEVSDSSGAKETGQAGRRQDSRSRARTKEIARVRSRVRSILKKLEGPATETVREAQETISKLLDEVVVSPAMATLQRFGSKFSSGEIRPEYLPELEQAEADAIQHLLDIKVFRGGIEHALPKLLEGLSELGKLLDSENETVVEAVPEIVGDLGTLRQTAVRAEVAVSAAKVLEQQVKEALKRGFNYELAAYSEEDMQAAEVSFWRAVDKVALPETGGGSDDTPADGGGQEGPVAADEKEGDSPSRLPGEPARSREPPPLSAVPEICDSLVAALQIQKQLLQRVMNDVLSQLLVDRAARGKRLVARMHAFFTYSKKTFESWIRHYDLAGPGPFTVKQSTAYALLADLVRDSEKSLETLQKWFYVMSWRKSVVEY